MEALRRRGDAVEVVEGPTSRKPFEDLAEEGALAPPAHLRGEEVFDQQRLGLGRVWELRAMRPS
jgi:hypothetical protein